MGPHMRSESKKVQQHSNSPSPSHTTRRTRQELLPVHKFEVLQQKDDGYSLPTAKYTADPVLLRVPPPVQVSPAAFRLLRDQMMGR
jgi:hypothetical protein